jgi:hypothetical protein
MPDIAWFLVLVRYIVNFVKGTAKGHNHLGTSCSFKAQQLSTTQFNAYYLTTWFCKFFQNRLLWKNLWRKSLTAPSFIFYPHAFGWQILAERIQIKRRCMGVSGIFMSRDNTFQAPTWICSEALRHIFPTTGHRTMVLTGSTLEAPAATRMRFTTTLGMFSTLLHACGLTWDRIFHIRIRHYWHHPLLSIARMWIARNIATQFLLPCTDHTTPYIKYTYVILCRLFAMLFSQSMERMIES